jgi:hypothetical protein
MKHKFYYNAVAGNNNDGYMAKYVDENEKEFDFNVIPGISTSTADCISLRLSKNTAGLYYLPFINTVYTPSAFFEWNEDTSFFDPMSVLCLANSYGKSYNLNQKYYTTNKALAYPIKLSGMLAMNHYLQALNNKNAPDAIQYWTSYSYIGDLREAKFTSVVDESLKKEVFNYGISTNIRNIETQLDLTWDEIAEQSFDFTTNKSLKFQTLIGVRYPITSDPNIDFDAKISLSFNKGNYQYAARGPEFKTIYNSPTQSYYNGDLYYQYVTLDKRQIGKTDNAWQFTNALSGLYAIPLSSTYNLESTYNQELPSSIFFADELFYVEGSESSLGDVFLIPVYNENDEDEVYFTPIEIGTESPVPFIFPPRSENLLLSQLGKIRLYKDKEQNKWILKFSADTVSYNGYYNPAVGHFECSGDRDPWTNPTQADFNETGLVLTYIDGKGVENPNAYLRIYPRRFIGPGSILIPYFLGDSRFKVSNWSYCTGREIQPKYPLYSDDFQKVKTYVCVDSGSYTIPV